MTKATKWILGIGGAGLFWAARKNAIDTQLGAIQAKLSRGQALTPGEQEFYNNVTAGRRPLLPWFAT